ncbi:MAG TPA: ferritin family protein [Spirochaetota bacterium]|nr:ferritin family protein [Spirochaetota bacterium]HNT11081.1 ferritin family protein [Spirochaetota bacterium]HNV48703.1 ferritin family protein [Spirochaetota bacterium]HPU90051.1 ferritin family protein [Spirochaetota bacterium]
MKANERLNALEVALNNEMNERQFYLNNAERTRNPVGKAMFARIADDELEHYEMLKKLHAEWTANGKWPDTVPLTVNKTSVKTILQRMVDESKDAPASDSDDLAAVQAAAQFESKGVDLYRELAEASTDKKEKEFFMLLSGIEREHFLSLKDMEEFIRNPSAWYTAKERHGMDGA